MLMFLALLTPSEPDARYPIPPQPLRWLYADADLVLIGVAGKTREIKVDPDEWNNAVVDLAVRKILKGRMEGNSVSVRHHPNMICPQPDTYPEGKVVLAFLCRSKRHGDWVAPGLSYASKLLSEDGLAVYERRVLELGAMEGGRSLKVVDENVVEWLVKCMEYPATRWEGAYEFDTQRDFPRIRLEEGVPGLPLKLINNDQWKRLVDSFAGAKTCSGGELTMASKVLHQVPDPRIDHVLLRGVEASLGEEHPWQGEAALKIVASRMGSDEALAFVRELDKTDFNNVSARKDILRRFVAAKR